MERPCDASHLNHFFEIKVKLHSFTKQHFLKIFLASIFSLKLFLKVSCWTTFCRKKLAKINNQEEKSIQCVEEMNDLSNDPEQIERLMIDVDVSIDYISSWWTTFSDYS